MNKLNLRQGLAEGQKNPGAPNLPDTPEVVVATGNTPEPKRAAMIDGRLSRNGTTAKTIPQAPETVALIRRIVGGSNKGTVLNHLLVQGIAAAIVLSHKSGGKTLVRETAEENNGQFQKDLELIFGKDSAEKAMQALQWARENPIS
jgi:hypothetical protein